MKDISELNFQPFIGKEFGKQENNKVLFLAESFYEKDINISTTNHTSELINEFLDGETYNLYMTIGRLFDNIDCRKIWNEIAYANFIQRFFLTPSELPTKGDIEIGNNAFKVLLDTLKPDKVIVFSKRIWGKWITDENGTFIGPIYESGMQSTIWKYNYNSGQCIATGINHPSRIKGDAQIEIWSRFIKKFLEY